MTDKNNEFRSSLKMKRGILKVAIKKFQFNFYKKMTPDCSEGEIRIIII